MTVTCLTLKNYKSFLQRNGLGLFASFWVVSLCPRVIEHSVVGDVFPANAMVEVSLLVFM